MKTSIEPYESGHLVLPHPLLSKLSEGDHRQVSIQQLQSQIGKGTGGCVLVIDDESSILDLMTKFLSLCGITTKGFANPYRALHWYKNNWESVDLIFLDMKNPHMNGEHCFALLQSINPEVRVALISGSADADTVNELLEEGALRYFPKPFDFPSVMSWTIVQITRVPAPKRKSGMRMQHGSLASNASFSLKERGSGSAPYFRVSRIAARKKLPLHLHPRQRLLPARQATNTTALTAEKQSPRPILWIEGRHGRRILEITREPELLGLKCLRDVGSFSN